MEDPANGRFELFEFILWDAVGYFVFELLGEPKKDLSEEIIDLLNFEMASFPDRVAGIAQKSDSPEVAQWKFLHPLNAAVFQWLLPAVGRLFEERGSEDDVKNFLKKVREEIELEEEGKEQLLEVLKEERIEAWEEIKEALKQRMGSGKQNTSLHKLSPNFKENHKPVENPLTEVPLAAMKLSNLFSDINPASILCEDPLAVNLNTDRFTSDDVHVVIVLSREGEWNFMAPFLKPETGLSFLYNMWALIPLLTFPSLSDPSAVEEQGKDRHLSPFVCLCNLMPEIWVFLNMPSNVTSSFAVCYLGEHREAFINSAPQPEPQPHPPLPPATAADINTIMEFTAEMIVKSLLAVAGGNAALATISSIPPSSMVPTVENPPFPIDHPQLTANLQEGAPPENFHPQHYSTLDIPVSLDTVEASLALEQEIEDSLAADTERGSKRSAQQM
uniref:Uncharacterized protein n=1 Tax=Chromera velia CCMP2878 TaxID=1169474 RepID=A0A0G4FBR5_9ALVE|eukprot:Cvel_16079.t1-p1 / transcript=Cvel_16079.t1 / gene=Cvel_16079 / organism=Chromera_velia_CCMP2878 / gene_product=hypothetical protein / transcript_product=hypothetical protein / location=Cvel_scaffold1222:15693-21835(+) / protein_length=444 / sequence_SO=supercontig / SO=protein_coding / is_pseudo=false